MTALLLALAACAILAGIGFWLFVATLRTWLPRVPKLGIGPALFMAGYAVCTIVGVVMIVKGLDR